jgi:hypothetical protein
MLEVQDGSPLNGLVSERELLGLQTVKTSCGRETFRAPRPIGDGRP